jgi:hypothetical protein
MNCGKARRAVAVAWGGGEAPGWRARRHLRSCSECAIEARAMEEILDQAAGLPDPDPGPAYWEEFLPRVHRRIATSGAAPSTFGPPRISVLRPVRMAAAGAALLAAGLSLWAWRYGAFSIREPDIETLQAMLEAKIERSDPEARRSAADLLTPGGAEPIGGATHGWEDSIDDDLALRTVGDVTRLLSPSDMEGWPDLEEMSEGLTVDQIKRLIVDLDAPGDASGSATGERSKG